MNDINKLILPCEESMEAFFGNLGITNFWNGDPALSFPDSGYIDSGDLDRIVIEDSKYSHEYPLWHVNKDGSIRPPRFISSVGEEYTFISAEYTRGQFRIMTKINATERPYTIRELRNMIGPLPSKPRHGFWFKVASLFR